jgi:hypothetical protein
MKRKVATNICKPE